MPDTFLLLGPIVFQDFEVPERINFGGAQRLALHQLPGGVRVIDTLGRDDAEITFNGTFTGSDATLRARAVDELRALGSVLPLTWNVFTYTVIIKEFQAEFNRAGWIPFRIVCTVVRDEAAALIEAPLALAGSLLGDFATAQTLTLGLSIAAITGAIGTGGDLLAPSSATQRGSHAYTAATDGIARARDSMAAAIQTEESALRPQSLTTGLHLETDVTVLGRLATLVVAHAYISRAATNLSHAAT